jgi:glutamine kinase
MKKNNFFDKATTLQKLKIKSAVIPSIISFEVNDYQKNKKYYLKKIKKKFKEVAIRSSNFSEDTKKTSAAGKFLSILNTKANENKKVNYHINQVVNSYKNFKHRKNRILIQEMVKDIAFSGVATSCVKEDKSPYYVINMSKSSDSTVITSGKDTNNETYFIYENCKVKLPNNLLKIKKLIDELKIKFKEDLLDIEFALNKKGKLFLLQVRKLIIKKNKDHYQKDKFFKKHLDKLSKKITKIKQRNYSLLGKTTFFGVMPDWNPAEIIGRRPSPLALSLYKELITDNIWALQRRDYGYKNLENRGLLSSFFGMPYIDTRVDFNSWVPAKLDNKISEKLVNFYLNKLEKNPHLHDKIEFKIAITCFTFSINKRINELPGKIFSKKEKQKIVNSLKNINLISYKELKKTPEKLIKLEKRIKKISDSKTYNLDKIYWLIEDCKKFGTLPFAGMARCGFIAVELINSLVEENVISPIEKQKFLKSIKTVASDLSLDLLKKDKKIFLKKYGHLRPNTYDIDTLNYKDGYRVYFNKKNIKKEKYFDEKYNFSKKTLIKIDQLLKRYNHPISAVKLINFICESIKLREYSKFIFSKSINEIFVNLKTLFKRTKLNHDDIKFLSIQTIKELYYSLNHNDLNKIFFEEIQNSKIQYIKNKFIKLPSNIFNQNDVYFFKLEKDEPNFITNQNITGEILFLKNLIKSKKYTNKIICIENADPGYDFLFSYNIKGLITKYGGVNSHMAIRCNELNVAAAIGVGDKIFSDLIYSNKVQLNCINKTLQYI